MINRAVCLVPGCMNSSAKFAGFRYICSRHWRMIPKTLKRRDRLLIRRLKARGEVTPEGLGMRYLTRRAQRLVLRSWERLEQAAIEAAAGL